MKSRNIKIKNDSLTSLINDAIFAVISGTLGFIIVSKISSINSDLKTIIGRYICFDWITDF